MPNQASGLRFDIFERVYLDNEIQGIDTLEELELVPRIEVETEGEQALLKGHLLLSARYAAAGEYRESGVLEHQIPVEITLPMSRVNNLEEIGIRIDHFDVDLVSPKSLNVTGILSLSGIEVANTAQPDWEREDVFVHEVSASEARQAETEQPADPENASGNDAIADDETAEEPAANGAAEQDPADAEAVAEAAQGAERVEPKIAFASQKSHDGIAAEAAAEEAEAAEATVETKASKSGADGLEWKKLFLSREGEDQTFSQMRLCIVQKEETLERIAERYGKNPRELVLFNRLGDQTNVQEGQIIYIPR